MNHCIRVLLLMLGAGIPVAHAQQSGGGLDATQVKGQQVFAQSCGVCHLPPTLGAKTYGPPLNKASAAGNDEALRIIIANGTERMRTLPERRGIELSLRPAISWRHSRP